MDIDWRVGREDVARVKALVLEQANSALVRQRKAKNLSRTKPQVRRKRFWYQMVSMRLTSIQRSGPNSHVANFNRTKPFPLDYEAVSAEKHVDRFISNVLKKAGGIRFSNVIAHQLAGNLRLLEQGEWDRSLKQCNRLVRPASPAAEKEIASYIQDKFAGFGPKQARNFLQALGLTRYEIPIDSRVTAWLNELGFPFRLSATALADVNYYEFVSEAVQRLCAKSHVYPCMLDAAIFASRDGDAWTDANVY
jgi:thermostable 8-oxoguanine DNA glycosylase